MFISIIEKAIKKEDFIVSIIEIHDDNFIESITVEELLPFSTYAASYMRATIRIYEKKNLPVAPNLFKCMEYLTSSGPDIWCTKNLIEKFFPEEYKETYLSSIKKYLIFQ